MSKMLKNEMKKTGAVIKSIPKDRQPTKESVKRLDNEISSKKVIKNN